VKRTGSKPGPLDCALHLVEVEHAEQIGLLDRALHRSPVHQIAAVDAVEGSARCALAPPARTEANLAELPEPYQPVLPPGHGGELGVDRKLNTLRDWWSRCAEPPS